MTLPYSDPETLAHLNPEGFARKHRVEELEAQIAELASHLNAATWRLLQLIREFDELGGEHGTGARSLAHWLHWRCGFSLGAAREKVRVARALPALPKISEAFRTGELSYAKVRAVTRIATLANEDTLLNWALHGNASHLERLAKLYRRYGEDAAVQEQYRQRSCWHYTDDDGSLVIRARLPAELGAVVLKALEAALQDVFAETSAKLPDDVSAETPEGQADCPVSDPGGDLNSERVSAETPDTKCNLPSGAEQDVSAETPDPSAAPSGSLLPWNPHVSAETPEAPGYSMRMADALVRLAEHYLAPDPEPRALGERFQVHVHLDLRREADGPVDDPDAPGLARETIRRLGCEAGLMPIVHGDSGEILSVGRRTRAVPAPIRRALRLRDRGCRFPGCTHHKYVDAHHVHHWSDGGETKLSNLVELCRYHHRLLHEGGFGLTATDDGLFVFSRPDGNRIADVPVAPRIGGDGADALRHAQAELDIDHDTGRPRWDGTRMDYGFAIDALNARARRARQDEA